MVFSIFTTFFIKHITNNDNEQMQQFTRILFM